MTNFVTFTRHTSCRYEKRNQFGPSVQYSTHSTRNFGSLIFLSMNLNTHLLLYTLYLENRVYRFVTFTRHATCRLQRITNSGVYKSTFPTWPSSLYSYLSDVTILPKPAPTFPIFLYPQRRKSPLVSGPKPWPHSTSPQENI
jgi:hypothetical protein